MSEPGSEGKKKWGGLNAMSRLPENPGAYALPSKEGGVLQSRNNIPGYFTAAVTAILAGVAGLIAFRRRGETTTSGSPSPSRGGAPASPSPPAGEGLGGG